MKKNILALAVLAGMSVSVAQAASYTESFSIGMQTTDLTSITGETGNVAIGTFAQYDNSLGTLTSVDIAITSNSTSATMLQNTAANDQTFSFDSSLQWAFEILDTSAGDTLADLDFGATHQLSTTGGFTTLTSGQILDLGTVTDSAVYNVSIPTSSTAALSEFVGAGNVGIGCNTFSASTTTGSTNINATQSTEAGCSAVITYNYNVATVPAPSAMALLGLGLSLVGFQSIARKRKQA